MARVIRSATRGVGADRRGYRVGRGRWFRLSPARVRSLIPAGAAEALSTAFNTPVAAVIFAEIIGNLNPALLGSTISASVASVIGARSILGNESRAAQNAAIFKSGNVLLALKDDGELIVADAEQSTRRRTRAIQRSRIPRPGRSRPFQKIAFSSRTLRRGVVDVLVTMPAFLARLGET